MRVVVEADERAQDEPTPDPEQLLPDRGVLRERPPASELGAQGDQLQPTTPNRAPDAPALRASLPMTLTAAPTTPLPR